MSNTPAFKPNARKIFDLRYPRKDENGDPAETPSQVIERVASNVASVTAIYADETEEHGYLDVSDRADDFPYRTARRQYAWLNPDGDFGDRLSVGWTRAEEQADKYRALLTNLDFLPNSPTWTGAGTPLGQLAACFVLPIEDDLGRGPDSIMSILHKATLIQQTGGGNGFSMGRLRPKDAIVHRSMGRASGPLGFATMYDATFRQIAQGGSRRGANMLVMPVWHPDIESFIEAKVEEGKLDQFNFSVGVTDEFMQAVIADGDFDLRFNGEAHRTIRARDLWDKLVSNAWVIGDPGVLFLDRANAQNPCPTRYTLEATNPCVTGETLVATPDGWRRADSIKEGDEICTVLGSGEVKEIEVNPAVPVYKVTFSDGGVVRATAAHKFHVRSSQTKFFTPTRLDQIQVGQWVRVAKGEVPSNTVPMPAVPGVGLSRYDYGLLMGTLAGDGSCSPKTVANGQVAICSSADDAEWNDVVCGLLDRWGCGSVGRHQDSESKALRLYPQPSRAFSEWLAQTPYIPSLAPERTLPQEFINSNEDFLLGLLDGLFSTDGSVNLRSNHPQIRFHTASQNLAEQVRLMLLYFGVHSRISKSSRKPHTMADGREIRYDRPKYDLTISGESFGRFADQITLSHPQKQAKLDEARLRCNFTGGNWAAKIVSIEPDGIETVYDLYEPQSDTWLTAGYVSQGCGEQYLPPYSNCCLGSINVSNFVTEWGSAGEVGTFDWDGFRDTIRLATQFLDDVVDANQYVPEVPELEAAAMGERRIGLGLMGLADAMLKMGIRYGSPEGLSFASQVTEWARYWSMLESTYRAEERGPFEWIEGSIYDPAMLTTFGAGAPAIDGLDGKIHDLWDIPTPHDGSWHYDYNFGTAGPLDWNHIFDRISTHGIRNACQFTFAPTGTISNVAGLEGSGCEPLFALVYQRTVMQEGENLILPYLSGLFLEALERADAWVQAGMDKDDYIAAVIAAITANDGSCQGVDLVPDSIRQVFVVAGDLTGEEHVWMQAVLQAWVDNSISKTINLPNEATPEDVARVYRLAYDLGCKGITIYRQGSRSLEVLATTTDTEGHRVDWPEVVPLAIPAYAATEGLDAKVFPVETFFGKVQVTITTINGYGDRPFDVRLQIGKGGNDKNADVEALGRMISLSLRSGVRVKDIVGQLEHIGGATSHGFGERKVRSVADGVGKLLRRLYVGGDEVEVDDARPVTQLTISQGDVCPNCLQATVVMESGCRHCEIRLGGCGTYSGCD